MTFWCGFPVEVPGLTHNRFSRSGIPFSFVPSNYTWQKWNCPALFGVSPWLMTTVTTRTNVIPCPSCFWSHSVPVSLNIREFDVRKRAKRGGNQEKVRIFNMLIIKNKLYNDFRQYMPHKTLSTTGKTERAEKQRTEKKGRQTFSTFCLDFGWIQGDGIGGLQRAGWIEATQRAKNARKGAWILMIWGDKQRRSEALKRA